MTDQTAVKPKRTAHKYAIFVKQLSKDKDILAIKNSRERITKIAEMWRQHKAKSA